MLSRWFIVVTGGLKISPLWARASILLAILEPVRESLLNRGVDVELEFKRESRFVLVSVLALCIRSTPLKGFVGMIYVRGSIFEARESPLFLIFIRESLFVRGSI